MKDMNEFGIKVVTELHNRTLNLNLGLYTRKRDAIRGLSRVMKNNHTLAFKSPKQEIIIYNGITPLERVFMVGNDYIVTLGMGNSKHMKFHTYKFNY